MTTGPGPLTFSPQRRLAAGVAAVVATDQASKAAPDLLMSWWPGGLVRLHNPALSLEVIRTDRWSQTLAMAVCLLAAGLFLVPRTKNQRLSASGAALLLGGATANLIDRALLGAVRDFLPIGTIAVNLADLAVIVGLTILAVSRFALPIRKSQSALRTPA